MILKQNLKKYLTYLLKNCRGSFDDLELLVTENPCHLNFFAKLHKNSLLIANIIKDTVLGLRQSLANKNL